MDKSVDQAALARMLNLALLLELINDALDEVTFALDEVAFAQKHYIEIAKTSTV